MNVPVSTDLTLRDCFAAITLLTLLWDGELSNGDLNEAVIRDGYFKEGKYERRHADRAKWAAAMSYKMADEMLKERAEYQLPQTATET